MRVPKARFPVFPVLLTTAIVGWAYFALRKAAIPAPIAPYPHTTLLPAGYEWALGVDGQYYQVPVGVAPSELMP